MSAPALRRFTFAYATAFAFIYVVVRARGLALFTVYPAQGVVLPGTHRSRDAVAPAMGFLAPEMFFYGWTAAAAIGALVVAMVAALLPERWCPSWPWCVWVVPATAMIACVYLTLPWFRLEQPSRGRCCTSRQFAATQHFARFRSKADID